MFSFPAGPDTPPSEQAKQWIERPLELLDVCANKFGDVFSLDLGGFGTFVVLGHPDAVRTIFKAPSEMFECRYFNESYRYVMGSHAIFLQDGHSHKRIKRIMMPKFGRACVLEYAVDVGVVTRQVIRAWGLETPFRPHRSMHEISLRVLLKIVFGRREEAIKQVLGWFEASVWRDMRAWKPWTALSRLHPQIRELISSELRHRRERLEVEEKPDLLDCLQSSRDEEGQALSDEEIQDQVLTLMITAGDAVAVALMWALSWVSRSSDVQDRIRTELDTLGDVSDPREVIRLPYLAATCQEVLRLNTVLPTVSGRRLTAPMDVMGYRLGTGTTVAPCEYLVHRRGDLYPEPLVFRPGRFLDQQYSPFEYFPFGGGNRACLGTALAPMEMKLVLATILSRGGLAPCGRGPVGVVRYGTLLAPSDELTVEFR